MNNRPDSRPKMRSWKGLKNEENARQVVQKDLAVMKEEIKNLTS